MRSFRMNRPSAGELVSLCAGSYAMDTSRFDQSLSSQGFSQSRRESQVTATQPLAISSVSRSDDLVEQRLAALEFRVAAVADSIGSLRKDLDDQNRNLSFRLKEEEGAIKRLLDQLQAVPAKLSGDLRAAMRAEIKQALLESDDETVSHCSPKNPNTNPSDRSRTRSRSSVENAKQSSIKRKFPDDETRDDEQGDSADVDFYVPSAKDLKKMRERLLRARRNMKKRT